MDTQIKDSYVLTRGEPVYIPASGVSGSTIPPAEVYSGGQMIEVKTEKELFIAGMPETVALSECERVYLQMDEIVKEARAKFGG